MNYKLDRNYTQEELDFIVLKYKSKTDEELLKLIRDITKELGRPPKKEDVPAYYYLKQRFGPWPRMLERAGVKEVSPTYQRRKQARTVRREERIIERNKKKGKEG